jgi:conjugal transfer pilus assembly protein TraU
MKKFFLFAALLCSFSSHAGSCGGHFVNPIHDVCWSCLFPLSLGSQKLVASNHLPDTKNPKNPLCSCSGNPLPRVGLAIGFWEPAILVDVTRTPFCMVNLGGISLNYGKYYRKGGVETSSHLSNQSRSSLIW